jgi:hypothetical protein
MQILACLVMGIKRDRQVYLVTLDFDVVVAIQPYPNQLRVLLKRQSLL